MNTNHFFMSTLWTSYMLIVISFPCLNQGVVLHHQSATGGIEVAVQLKKNVCSFLSEQGFSQAGGVLNLIYAALVVVQGSLKFTAAVAPLWATFTAGTSQSVPSSTYHMAASVFTCKKAFSQRSPLYHIPFPQFGCFLSIFHMRIECHWFCFGSSFFGLPVFFQFLPKT